jgi:hypothetical protein
MRSPWITLVVAVVLTAPVCGQSDRKYVDELLTILETTHSPDAFMVALTQLKEAGADSHQAIPSAIRNAERLGIFADHLSKEGDPRAARAAEVAELIEQLGAPAKPESPGKRTRQTSSKTENNAVPTDSDARYTGAPQYPKESLRSERRIERVLSVKNVLEVIGLIQSDLEEWVGRVCESPFGLIIDALKQSLSPDSTFPVPVPPWVNTPIEERHVGNDFRTAILPPIKPGDPPPACEEPPDDAQVMRALKPVPRGTPHVFEEFREDIEIVTERIVDRIDPPRFYPLVGWAQLHHCHYKCTVYFTQTRQSSYPFPFAVKKPCTEVVYIDKDHLHLVSDQSEVDRLEQIRKDLAH